MARGITSMGKLKPGASYIYEKIDGVTYAKEVDNENCVVILGRDYTTDFEVNSTVNQVWGVSVLELEPFAGLIKMAKNDPALQEELDKLVTFYVMARKSKDEYIMWHPV